MKAFVTLLITFIFLFLGMYVAFTLLFTYTEFKDPLDIEGKINIIEGPRRTWDMQSIDTMKFSRDRSREVSSGAITQVEIDTQISNIASTGATHVSIGTPYDSEFLPVLKIWVATARKYKLSIWFRSNFSGWEGWFDYPRIDKETHTAKTKAFIESNPDLFADGDIFTSCTECENGHKVAYNNPVELQAHREFLINEYNVAKTAFQSINKDVQANYYSMNGDLAKAMMDRETTRKLDGIVVVDHYVTDSKKLAQDLRDLAASSGGTIILGEFGAPVPDLHGQMTEEEQALWVKETMHEVASIHQVGGVNYWVNLDGTTALWTNDGKSKPVVEVVTEYFTGKIKVIKYSN